METCCYLMKSFGWTGFSIYCELFCASSRLHVIDELLDCARASGSTSVAFDLVQLAVSYSLPNTAKLAQTVLDEFTLTEEQRYELCILDL